jgi:hypothetical protein
MRAKPTLSRTAPEEAELDLLVPLDRPEQRGQPVPSAARRVLLDLQDQRGHPDHKAQVGHAETTDPRDP